MIGGSTWRVVDGARFRLDTVSYGANLHPVTIYESHSLSFVSPACVYTTVFFIRITRKLLARLMEPGR